MREKLKVLDALYAAGKLAEADERLLEWIREAESKGDKASLLTLYNEMEGLYRVTGRAEKACEAADRSLEAVRELSLTGTVHHATSLLNAATANRAAGHSEKALSLYQEAERLYLSMPDLPEQNYHLAALYNNMSQVCQDRGDFAEAELFLRKALSLIENDKSESDLATTRANLAQVLAKLGKLEEARQLSSLALSFYESVEGKKSSHVPAGYFAMGEVCFCLKEYKEALSWFQRALDRSLEIFGETPEAGSIRSAIQETRRRLEADAP